MDSGELEGGKSYGGALGASGVMRGLRSTGARGGRRVEGMVVKAAAADDNLLAEMVALGASMGRWPDERRGHELAGLDRRLYAYLHIWFTPGR